MDYNSQKEKLRQKKYKNHSEKSHHLKNCYL